MALVMALVMALRVGRAGAAGAERLDSDLGHCGVGLGGVLGGVLGGALWGGSVGPC